VQAKKDKVAARKLAIGNTFEAVARAWLEHWKGDKSARHSDYVIRRLEADVFPALGAKPIADITAPQLLSMAKKIESRGAVDIAKRCLQTCGQVMRYAIAHGIIERNPAADVKPSDALKPRRKEHYARLDVKELPELLRHMEVYQGSPFTRVAMKIMALTFVRTGELIAADWSEFDLKAAEWRIPAARMKMRTPHVVPLSAQAIEALQCLHQIREPKGLLFPGERDHEKPMSNNTILKALERMGYGGRMTGHGFRGIASTVLHEHGFDHAHIELQLAHMERDEVSAAYNFATYLPQRRKMMQWWADHLDHLRRGAEIIDLKTA
jgi:integrase